MLKDSGRMKFKDLKYGWNLCTNSTAQKWLTFFKTPHVFVSNWCSRFGFKNKSSPWWKKKAFKVFIFVNLNALFSDRRFGKTQFFNDVLGQQKDSGLDFEKWFSGKAKRRQRIRCHKKKIRSGDAIAKATKESQIGLKPLLALRFMLITL